MKQLYTKKSSSSTCNSLKLSKLNYLLQNTQTFNKKNGLNHKIKGASKETSYKQDPHKNLPLSTQLSLYLSLVEKPLNLLFSIDDFVFEFSKKTYQQKKKSDFFLQLKERKKLSIFYGHLPRNQILTVFEKALYMKGSFSKNVLCLLERRLDVVLYRSGVAKTISEARQLITHKKIHVNHLSVNVPSYLLNPGDMISVMSETATHVSQSLLNQTFHKRQRRYPRFFHEFYAKLKHTLKTGSTLKNRGSSAKTQGLSSSIQNRVPSRQNTFQSKLLCDLLVRLLCAQLKKKYNYSSKQTQKSSSISVPSHLKTKGAHSGLENKSLYENEKQDSHENSVVTGFKKKKKNLKIWLKKPKKKFQKTSGFLSPSAALQVLKKVYKTNTVGSFSKNDVFRKNKEKSNNRYKNKNLVKGLVNPKQKYNSTINRLENSFNSVLPLFWGRCFLNLKKITPSFRKFQKIQKFKNFKFQKNLNLKKNVNSQKLKIQQGIKNFKRRRFLNKNCALYRRSFLIFLKSLNSYKKFAELVSLNLKKILFKRHFYKKKTKSILFKTLNFRATKAMHLEVSYNLLNIIYLYSPQRLNFPFYIDLDLIKRSLR